MDGGTFEQVFINFWTYKLMEFLFHPQIFLSSLNYENVKLMYLYFLVKQHESHLLELSAEPSYKQDRYGRTASMLGWNGRGAVPLNGAVSVYGGTRVRCSPLGIVLCWEWVCLRRIAYTLPRWPLLPSARSRSCSNEAPLFLYYYVSPLLNLRDFIL